MSHKFLIKAKEWEKEVPFILTCNIEGNILIHMEQPNRILLYFSSPYTDGLLHWLNLGNPLELNRYRMPIDEE